MNRYSFFLLAIIFLRIEDVLAQDPQFSQYFSSPLILNPANTGNSEGSRIGAHYRRQWLGVGEPFTTAMLSFDGKLLHEKLDENDKFGYGIMAMYDQSINGAFKSTYTGLSLSYHKGLDPAGRSSIGLGFQSVLGSRRLDYNKVGFFNQFSSGGFDLSLPSGENFRSSSLIYFDFNVGAIYNYIGDRSTFYIGASYYHIPRPEQSLLGDSSYRLPARYSLHSGASFNVGENGKLFLSGLFMQQGKAIEANAGISYGYYLPGVDHETALITGIWYRNHDAVYPYIGIQHMNLLLGLSYDVNTSGLARSATTNGSFELSLIYTIKDKKGSVRKLVPWY